MKVLATAGDIGATIADIRLCRPLAAVCEADGWQLSLRSLHDCTHADLAGADVLVLQRGITRRAWRLQQRMQAGGGHVVFEIDDLLTEMPPQSAGAAAVRAGQRWLLQGIAHADAVSCSTQRLADALRPMSRRISVVPNHAPTNAPRAAPRDPAAPLTLLFAASDRITAGWLLPAVAAAAAARPGRLRLASIGSGGLDLDALALPLQRFPLLPRADFLAAVAALPNPLALIPLDESPFSRCKSAVKFFDYAAVGVPALCSNVPPYADIAVDGSTAALVDNSVGAWTAALLRAVDEPAWCQRLADAAAAEVPRLHTSQQTAQCWRELLTSIGKRRAEAPAQGFGEAVLQRLQRALRAANRARLQRRRRQR